MSNQEESQEYVQSELFQEPTGVLEPESDTNQEHREESDADPEECQEEPLEPVTKADLKRLAQLQKQDTLIKRCNTWMRKQYFKVTVRGVSNYDFLSWKKGNSVGIVVIGNKEQFEIFRSIKWYDDFPAQYRICFTYPGMIRRYDIPRDWGVVEAYHTDIMIKKEPKKIKEFGETVELDLLGKELAKLGEDAPPEYVSALVDEFRLCFEASGLNDNRQDLVELVSTGKFAYLFRGEEIK